MQLSLRTIASLVVAVFLGLVAVLLLRNVLSAQKPAALQASSTQVPVVVANVPIGRGVVLKTDMLKVVSFTRESAPPGSFAAVNQVIVAGQPDKVALRDFAANEPLTVAKISGPGAKSNLSGMLTPGMRAVGLRSSDVAGVGGFILPGDRVDILLTRQNGAGDKVQTIEQVLAENARVLGVDQSSDADKPTVAKAITVEVTPDQAQAISLAQAVGQVSLSLRQSADMLPLKKHAMTLADLGGGEHKAPVVRRAPPPPKKPDMTQVRVTRGVAVTGYGIPN
jgi:pilus assembly protein CpaB